MDPKRIGLYQALDVRIGNTSLRQYRGQVPNGCRLFVKDESANPFGSHYDRVYLHLFRTLEETGKINPGQGVFETTSGSAGASFAGIGGELGYVCHVAIPDGGEQARVKAIEGLGGIIHKTPAEKYVNSFPEWSLNFFKENRGKIYPLNHSMGKGRANNETTLSALEGIAYESLGQLGALGIVPDYFIPAIGNGSSVLGPGKVFKKKAPGLKIVGFETLQSGAAFDIMYPGRYEELHGIKPGTLGRHNVPGTSFPGISVPHLNNAIRDGVLDDVILISDAWMNEEYQSLTGRTASNLPRWDDPLEDCRDFGRSTLAGINVALMLAQKERDKSFILIGYDKADRYDRK